MNRDAAYRIGFGWLAALLLGCGGCKPDPRSEVERYPERSIDLIVPWTPGGGSDRVARYVADALQQRLGRPVVVVNRTGGGGAVGHTAGALAAPDGYTLTLGTFELGTMRWMGISDVNPGDFTPVALLNADAAAVFVRRDAPWADLRSFLEAIRKEPGRLRLSGTASGGVWDLARSGWMMSEGLSPGDVTWVPAPGSAPAMVELLGGHIDAVCCSVPEAWAQVQGGEIRALGVFAKARLLGFESIPTAEEQGMSFEAMTWRGVLVPRGTPTEIVARLGRELVAVGESEGYQAFLKKNGFTGRVEGPDGFARFLASEEPRWRDVIRSAGYETLGRNRDPGPMTMPMVLVAMLGVALVLDRGAVFLGRTRDGGGVVGISGVGIPREGILWVGAMGGYVLAMALVGFVGATLVFAVLAQRWLGAGWWGAVATSAGLVGAVHLLFVGLFKVPLP
ncbi:MAG: tripartite tricarboxylate transporter substrate-binding protein [Limisphaerales bacterium]